MALGNHPYRLSSRSMRMAIAWRSSSAVLLPSQNKLTMSSARALSFGTVSLDPGGRAHVFEDVFKNGNLIGIGNGAECQRRILPRRRAKA